MKNKEKQIAVMLFTLIILSAVLFALYRFLLERVYYEYVLAVYTAVSVSLLAVYLIYNRGFSRKNVSADMLPDTMSEEEKTAFIKDAENRIAKSKPLLIITISFFATFVFDAIELYVVPFFTNLLG